MTTSIRGPDAAALEMPRGRVKKCLRVPHGYIYGESVTEVHRSSTERSEIRKYGSAGSSAPYPHPKPGQQYCRSPGTTLDSGKEARVAVDFRRDGVRSSLVWDVLSTVVSARVAATGRAPAATA